MTHPRSFPRLVVFDLDGTLLDAHERVADRTRTALEAITARGTATALASGRYWSLVERTAAEVGPAMHYGIASNGSVVGSFIAGQIIDRVTIPRHMFVEVVRLLRRHDPRLGFTVQTDDFMVFEPGFLDRSPLRPKGEEIADVLDYDAAEPLKMWVFHPDHDEDSLIALLAPLLPPSLGAGHTSLMAAEVGPIGVDKADGVARLARHLGIDRTDVMTFGDNSNDRTMLRWAGRSAALANADDITKTCATEVTMHTHDADGVARHLEEMLSGSKR